MVLQGDSESACYHLYVELVMMEMVEEIRDFGQILGENVKNSKNTEIIKKCLDAILDNIILHNLAKFQLSRSF